MIDVSHHLGLAGLVIKWIARRWPGLDRQELRAQAYYFLVEAAHRFDVSRGVAFSTYAIHRVYGKMREYCRREAHLIEQRREVRLPRGDEAAFAVVNNDIAAADRRLDLAEMIAASDLTVGRRETLAAVLHGEGFSDIAKRRGRDRAAPRIQFHDAVNVIRERYGASAGYCVETCN